MLEFRRLESIDLMRGFVMVLMALDHTRDFFSNALFDPTDLSQTNTALFLTRWMTHLCAPTFVFLTGVSAYLTTVRRNLSHHQLAWFLLTRGLWLIVLELTLVRFGWIFNWDYHAIFAQVIWALGWSMIVLAGLVYLPHWAIVGFAVITIVGHNGLDGIQPNDLGAFGWLWTILHVSGRIELFPGYTFYVAYPLIPWLGVMAAGYGFGPVFLQAITARKTMLLIGGISCIGAYLLLRLGNVYGDPYPWIAQKDALFTLFSILNCEKYPPSLLYLLMTLGLMFFGLVLFEWDKPHLFRKPLLIFGRVPLFFYLIHLPLIHGAALFLAYARGFPVDWLLGHGRHAFPTIPAAEYGYNLATVYGLWLMFMMILYPLCSYYAQFKHKHPDIVWLGYL